MTTWASVVDDAIVGFYILCVTLVIATDFWNILAKRIAGKKGNDDGR